MNRYEEIRAFVAVAGTGSLVGAARELNVTPSMIGRRITSLEQRLRTKLMHRSTRGIALTEPGTIFFERCRELLTTLEISEIAAFPDSSNTQEELVIVAPAFFGRKHVAPHVKTFGDSYSDVRVSLYLTNEYIEPVLESYDLRIRFGNMVHPDMNSIWLAENRRVICATPAYFNDHGRPATLQDLANHDCLAVRHRTGLRRDWRVQENGRPIPVAVEGRFDCNDGELLVRRAQLGHGIAWRPSWEVGRLLDSGELETVLDEFALPSFDIYAVYPRVRPLTGPTKHFIEILRRAYAAPAFRGRAGQ